MVASNPLHPATETDQDHGIQVSGLEAFPQDRWREAILHYLFGVWSDRKSVMYRPKISFGLLSLRLWPKGAEYYAEGRAVEYVPLFPNEEVLTVSHQQVDVEQGLIRFVKNDAIKMLVINLENHGKLRLWKKERRGEYGYSASRVPERYTYSS